MSEDRAPYGDPQPGDILRVKPLPGERVYTCDGCGATLTPNPRGEIYHVCPISREIAPSPKQIIEELWERIGVLELRVTRLESERKGEP